MASNEHNAREIDRQKSRLWALSSRGSVGVGPVGVQLFHLVNRETHRGHFFEVLTKGVGMGPRRVEISGSVGSSDHVNSQTHIPVSFFDFDGTKIIIGEANAGIYSWTTVSFWFASVLIADGGLNIPGMAASDGTINVMFGNGATYEADLEAKQQPIPPEPERFKNHSKDEAVVYRLPCSILFAYNKYRLRQDSRTQNALISIGNTLHSVSVPEWRWLVIGHTDSIGSHEFNLGLSRRRAETVADWFKKHNYGQPDWIKAIGVGKTEPIESNATAEGRAQNRRVEVVELKTKLWESYRATN
jgi:outer membrane protein OmpA-like peptidoglycan-associated protein